MWFAMKAEALEGASQTADGTLKEAFLANLLEIENLTVRYRPRSGAAVEALSGVSLALERGEALGILGESGCGKTTLALSVLRLLPRDGGIAAGEIRYAGNNLGLLSEKRLRQIRGREISHIFQEPALALNPVMRVGDQVAEVLRAHVPANRRDRRTAVLAAFDRVHLPDPGKTYKAYPHQLSGGQRQRVAIAQAICCQPSLLIADEPTSSLDAPLQVEILELLKELKQTLNTSLILITHYPLILPLLVDRVAVMLAGRVVEEGAVSDVFREPLHPYTAELLRLARNDRRHQEGTEISGGNAVKAARPEPEPANQSLGCAYQPHCPPRLAVCAAKQPEETAPALGRKVRCFKYDA
jgi:peptide/nickel transport system ATP-binding protein